MSRLPGTFNFKIVRGATWCEKFAYRAPVVGDCDAPVLDDCGNPKRLPVSLEGFGARMQVRTSDGQYGTSEAETVVMELTTDNGLLSIPDPISGTILLDVCAEDTIALNPTNAQQNMLVYSIELYEPAKTSPPACEVVIPFLSGRLTVLSEVTR